MFMESENIPSGEGASSSVAPASSSSVETSSSSESIRIPGTDKVYRSSDLKKSSEPMPKTDPISGANRDSKDVRDNSVKQNNSQNALRRQNTTAHKLRSKIAELEKQIEELRGTDPAKAELLQSQQETYQTIAQTVDADEYEAQAYETFGDSANKFIENTYRYSPYINAHEPELRQYVALPYGKILLNEWMKRMDNPERRQEWLQMPKPRRNQVLDSFYSKIEQIAVDVKNGNAAKYFQNGSNHQQNAQSTNQQPRNNIPAARGGRNSNANVPADDFGLALQQATQSFRRR